LIRRNRTQIFLIVIAYSTILSARASPVLVAEQLAGVVRVEHLGQSRQLHAGEALQERDVLRVGSAGHAVLRFGADGLLELGPDAALAIEKLPAADDVQDLRSIFSLWQGYLYVRWSPPVAIRTWPVYVYFAGQRSSLAKGEYFFERQGSRMLSCVASGALSVTAVSGGGLDVLRPSACYEPGLSPLRPMPRDAVAWDAARRDYALSPPATRAAAAATPAIADHAEPEQSIAADKATAAAAAPLIQNPTPSAATADLPAVEDGGWVVMVGAFSDPQNAAAAKQKLDASGYVAVVRVRTVNGKRWNSVQLRGFSTREAAQLKLTELQTQLGYRDLRVAGAAAVD